MKNSRIQRSATHSLLSSRLYCRFRIHTGSAVIHGSRTHTQHAHRRWGLTPRPEELILNLLSHHTTKNGCFQAFSAIQSNHPVKKISHFFSYLFIFCRSNGVKFGVNPNHTACCLSNFFICCCARSMLTWS
jgi:hypothetical protein